MNKLKYAILLSIAVLIGVFILFFTVLDRKHPAEETEENNKGELVARSGDISVYLTYQYKVSDDLPDDDFSYTEDMCLIRYVGKTPSDTYAIIGTYQDVVGDDSLVKIIAGVDTISMDFSSGLPDQVDTRFAGVLPDTHCATLSRHIRFNENTPEIDFQLNIGIPANASPRLKQYLSKTLREHIQDLFVDDIEEGFMDIDLYDLNRGSADEMLEYYFNEFSRLYKYACKDDSELDYELWNYANLFTFYPVWISEDNNLITFRYIDMSSQQTKYCFHFEGYLTLDCSTMKRLQWPDFYTLEECSAVIQKHENELYLDVFDLDRLYKNEDIADIYNSKAQPSPALLGDKIVFHYSKYYKGAVESGALYFTEPYSYDEKKGIRNYSR